MQLHRPRTYLLSLLTLALACNGGVGTSETDADTETSATEATDATDASSSGSTGAATEATTMGPGGSGTEDGSTGGETDPGATTGPGTTTGSGDDPCVALCELEESCGLGDPECLESCQLTYDIFSALGTCQAPFEAVFECVLPLSCEDYEAFYNEEGDYPCKAEQEALQGPDDEIPPCATENPPELCADACAGFDACGLNEGTVEECTDFCAYTIGTAPIFGEGCQVAYEALYACYVAADCEQLESPDICADEQLAVETECDG